MTCDEFATRLSKEFKISKRLAKQECKEVFYMMREIFMEGEELKVSDLGVWRFVDRKAKIGRNLKKNEPVRIPPRKKLIFEPCRKLENFINDM